MIVLRSVRRRLASCTKPARRELVEFAIALPLFLFVLTGIIDFGFLFQRYEVVTNAAREEARLKSLATTSSTADLQGTRRRVPDRRGPQSRPGCDKRSTPWGDSGQSVRNVTASGNQVVV